MPIQLIITGEHVTDVLAQIKQLNQATDPQEVVHTVQLNGNEVAAPKAEAPKREADPISEPEDVTEEEPPKVAPKKKKLSAKEQDALVEEIVKVGAVNDVQLSQLTKARQKKVNDALAEQQALAEAGAEAEIAEEPTVEDMFGDDEESTPEVTADDIRDLMGQLGKDADGNPVQENLVQIRAVLADFIPEGEEIKVGNIPAHTYQECFDRLKKLGE